MKLNPLDLLVGIVVSAVIIAGAIYEHNKEKPRDAEMKAVEASEQANNWDFERHLLQGRVARQFPEVLSHDREVFADARRVINGRKLAMVWEGDDILGGEICLQEGDASTTAGIEVRGLTLTVAPGVASQISDSSFLIQRTCAK